MGDERCTCHYWGNQHGHGFSFCEDHGRMMELVARITGESVDDLFNRIVREHCDRIKPKSQATSSSYSQCPPT